MDCSFKEREQYTSGTHYTDLDNLYGATTQQTEDVRAYVDGLLKNDIVPGSTLASLPVLDINQCIQRGVTSTGCIYSGDSRVGDWDFLSVMHTVMLRLHNYVANGLKEVNSHWSDETLFQEARRITVALWQHIIYSEYLQIALGQDTMNTFGLNSLDEGWSWNYDDYLYPNNFNEFATAAFRLHQTVPRDYKKADENLNEILPVNPEKGKLDELFKTQYQYYYNLQELIQGAVLKSTYTSDFSASSCINHFLNLLTDGNEKSSLPAITIQRGRDHGIRGYIEYRELAGESCPNDWNDLKDNFFPPCFEILKELYMYVADIDLWAGLICEKPDVDFLLPPTQRWLVGKNFYHNKYGDRFFYENGQDKVNRFTKKQLTVIRKFQFANLLCVGLGTAKVPEYGFFEPNDVDDSSESVVLDASTADTDKPFSNPLVECATLDALDFTPWNDMLAPGGQGNYKMY
jgi:peroxidase